MSPFNVTQNTHFSWEVLGPPSSSNSVGVFVLIFRAWIYKFEYIFGLMVF